MVKRDILDELLRDKKFLEMELAGLAQNGIVSYKEKIEKMTEIIKDVAVVNGSFGLLDIYFPEQKQEEQAPAPVAEQTVEAPVAEQTVEAPAPVAETPVPKTEEPVIKEEAVAVESSPFPKITK